MRSDYNPEIFREYDIRGVVGKDFDKKFAFQLGQAFVSYVNSKSKTNRPTLSLGQDARLSSPELADSLCEGMKAAGAKVYRLGLCTSPISYFSTFTIPNIAGGIMLTGSHNPADYNGFKLSLGSRSIFGADIMDLKGIIDSGNFANGAANGISTGMGSEEPYDIITPYVEKHAKEFKGLGGIKVILDCGNGAGGCVARQLFEACGLKPEILFEKPDGRFPNHHPDPTIEKNMLDARRALLASHAALAIGLDGDADRIGLLDDKGKFILGDEMMILISRSILKTHPGAPIIGDVKCSDRLYSDVTRHGGKAIMWKTGHSLIKSKIKEEKSPFGGELSGHIFFADRNFGYDDALYAGLRLCEIVAKTGKNISEHLSDLEITYSTPEIRIDTTEDKKRNIVHFLQEKFKAPSTDYKVNFIDGVRVSFKNGWALARASNTQPVLVLRFEASDQKSLDQMRSNFESDIRGLL